MAAHVAHHDHVDDKVKHHEELEIMRNAFKDADGIGLPMDDDTYLRYLRAR